MEMPLFESYINSYRHWTSGRTKKSGCPTPLATTLVSPDYLGANSFFRSLTPSNWIHFEMIVEMKF